MKKIIFSATAIFIAVATAHAEDSDIQTQSRQLREQNRMLTKRVQDLEQRQRKLETHLPKSPAVTAKSVKPREKPKDLPAADFAASKPQGKNPAVDDSLTWHGITLYGLVDMGVTYQNHGAPLSNTAGLGLNYLIAKNSNGSYFGVAPNALSSSFIGLKGEQPVRDLLFAFQADE